MKIDSDLNKQIVSLFQEHQSKISSDFAAINKTVEENISEWSRQNGGGGKTIILSGDKIEKAAINFSILFFSNLFEHPTRKVPIMIKIKFFILFFLNL